MTTERAMPTIREYLGDSVYAEIEEGFMVLYLSNGTNDRKAAILFDSETLTKLQKFIMKHKEKVM